MGSAGVLTTGFATLVLLLGGCGSAAPTGPNTPAVTSPLPAPTGPNGTTGTRDATAGNGIPRVSVDDDGSVLTLPLAGTAVLFLPTAQWNWSDPLVAGSAVTISEDVSDEGAGSRSWTLTSRERGVASVTTVGTPTCRTAADPCQTPVRQFVIDVVVR